MAIKKNEMNVDQWVDDVLKHKRMPRTNGLVWDHFFLGILFLLTFIMTVALLFHQGFSALLLTLAAVSGALWIWIYFFAGPKQLEFTKVAVSYGDRTSTFASARTALEHLNWPIAYHDGHAYIRAHRKWKLCINPIHVGQVVHILISPDGEVYFLSLHHHVTQADIWNGRNNANFKLFEAELRRCMEAMGREKQDPPHLIVATSPTSLHTPGHTDGHTPPEHSSC